MNESKKKEYDKINEVINRKIIKYSRTDYSEMLIQNDNLEFDDLLSQSEEKPEIV